MIPDLLAGEPVVAAAGVEVLAAAVEAQGVTIGRAAWRPPAGGTGGALAALAADERTARADSVALERLLGARPHLVDVARAGDVVPGLTEGTFLHAGPPVTWEDCSGPLRGALIGAMRYEGMAGSVEAAERLGPRLALSPCHHHHAVGPMAGVVSPSMPVAVVRDDNEGGIAYATFNEGLGRVLRYGSFDDEVIERLRWMEGVLAPVLRTAVHARGPLDLNALIAQALQMGDDGHNRNRAATSLFLRALGPHLVEGPGSWAERAAVFRFIDGNDHFALNLVMAAAKAATDAVGSVPGSGLVTAMARNGTEFGIRLAGTGERWFTAPAPVVSGAYLGSFTAADANPDIGDSAITETVGLGGFAMAAAPAIVGFVGGTAAGAVQRTLAMYEITRGEHPLFRIPILEGRGCPVGIDATLVVRTGVVPQINTGIAGRRPGVGMVGAGLVEAPLACFVGAVHALGEEALR